MTTTTTTTTHNKPKKEESCGMRRTLRMTPGRWRMTDADAGVVRTGARFFVPEDSGESESEDSDGEFDDDSGNINIMLEDVHGPDYTTPLFPPPAKVRSRAPSSPDPWTESAGPWSRRLAHRSFVDKYEDAVQVRLISEFMDKYATPSASLGSTSAAFLCVSPRKRRSTRRTSGGMHAKRAR